MSDLSSSSSVNSSLPRILCLHGFNQSADMFKQRCSTFKSHLKKKFEFICPLGPKTLPLLENKNSNSEDSNSSDSGDPRHCWWYYDEKDPMNINWEQISKTITSTDQLIGYAESRELIRKILENPLNNVQYVMGFSQGGAFASLLCQEGVIPTTIPVIFVSAFYPLPISSGSNQSLKGFTTWHEMGHADTIIDIALSKSLASTLFPPDQNQTHIHEHKGRHIIPKIKIPWTRESE